MTQRNTDEPVVVGPGDPSARGTPEIDRPFASDPGTFYAVSQVRLDDRQRVSEVVWSQVDSVSNRRLTDETRAPVADVVGVIYNGDSVFAVFHGQDGHVPRQRFMVAEHDDGNRSIVLEGVAGSASDLGAMSRIEG